MNEGKCTFCDLTGNPCGTDTWNVGNPPDCRCGRIGRLTADLSACLQECEGLRQEYDAYRDESGKTISEITQYYKAQLTSLQAAYAGAVEAIKKIHHRVASWGEPFKANPHTPGHRELMVMCDKALSSTPQSVKDVLDVLEAAKKFGASQYTTYQSEEEQDLHEAVRKLEAK